MITKEDKELLLKDLSARWMKELDDLLVQQRYVQRRIDIVQSQIERMTV